MPVREKHYNDDTIDAVMVWGVWYGVRAGTWEVFEGGAFERATWLDTHSGQRLSAFLKQIQMVRHAA